MYLQQELRREREAAAARIVELEEQIGELIRRGPDIFVTRGLTPIPDLPPRPRGVYVAEFKSARDNYILYAVDRRGCCVARVEVHEPRRWDEYVESIWTRLDDLDPIPVRLVP